jgi:AraC-like DNA-binding protein/ligand-binding sensor protein
MIESGENSGRRRRVIVDQLTRSELFRGYQEAFQKATGLPLDLCPAGTTDLPHQGNPYENPFCALMGSSGPTCAKSRQFQRDLEEAAGLRAETLVDYSGFGQSAVPVRAGARLLGFLKTGQVLLRRPTRREFNQTVRQLRQWGCEVEGKRLETAFSQTRVLTKPQYESILRLLTIFAQHLASLSHQLIVQEEKAESPQIARAKAFLSEHQSKDLSLSDVARAVNMSAFYFCKMFRQATGLTFTDYLARVRVDRVKNELVDPHKRISEVAFAAGFQSLSQFNRVFRKVAGESPTSYRERVRKTAAA